MTKYLLGGTTFALIMATVWHLITHESFDDFLLGMLDAFVAGWIGSLWITLLKEKEGG